MTDPMPDIPVAVKAVLIQQEITRWKNDQYVLTIRYTVNLRLKAEAAAEECKARLVDCELALNELNTLLAELPNEKET